VFGSDFKPVIHLLATPVIDREDRESLHPHLLEVDELDALGSFLINFLIFTIMSNAHSLLVKVGTGSS
jgi:hypothetical protein